MPSSLNSLPPRVSAGPAPHTVLPGRLCSVLSRKLWPQRRLSHCAARCRRRRPGPAGARRARGPGPGETSALSAHAGSPLVGCTFCLMVAAVYPNRCRTRLVSPSVTRAWSFIDLEKTPHRGRRAVRRRAVTVHSSVRWLPARKPRHPHIRWDQRVPDPGEERRTAGTQDINRKAGAAERAAPV